MYVCMYVCMFIDCTVMYKLINVTIQNGFHANVSRNVAFPKTSV